VEFPAVKIVKDFFTGGYLTIEKILLQLCLAASEISVTTWKIY
jgi:hypothetical protein